MNDKIETDAFILNVDKNEDGLNIIIPPKIEKLLGIKENDKLLFVKNDNSWCFYIKED
jgi:bifunctional DNA-binding transcriptional regulator/antitoxin component of YhaV-PrlF toxin-antitoxin module